MTDPTDPANGAGPEDNEPTAVPGAPVQADPESIWVVSDVATDGTYITAVQLTNDITIPLDHATGVRYATAVLAAGARALFDAAVYAQMTTGAKVPPPVALQAIAGLRAERPPADTAATHPLELRPGVNAAGKPFIALWLPKGQIGQWDVADATRHAMHVLEALEGAVLDAAYYTWLRSSTGLSERKARHMIADLSKWRGEEPAEGGGDPR